MINDKTQLNGFGSLQLPKLKGHVKITLHNPTTGKNEVIEGDNIVTNAVRDLLANNYLGALDLSKILPLWANWYSGILAYRNPHAALDPNNYFPQSENVNPLTAHAGDTPPTDYADDTRRGSPNTVIREITAESVRLGWEWGSTQGNGVISALSLCHKDVGNAGLGSDSAAFKAFNPFENVGNLANINVGLLNPDVLECQYDDSRGLAFFIGDDGEYYNNHSTFATTKITIKLHKLAYLKAGLLETKLSDNTYVDSFTVSTSVTFYTLPCYYFDYENKRLWLFSNRTDANNGYSKTNIQYSVIDCINRNEFAHGVIVSDTDNIAPLCHGVNTSGNWSGSRRYISNIHKVGNNFYFPTSDNPYLNTDIAYQRRTGYKRINIDNRADQEVITYQAAYDGFSGGMSGGGLLVNSGRVVNGNVGYNCLDFLPQATNAQTTARYTGFLFNEPNRISSYVVPLANFYESAQPRYILANKLVNTTLFNLPTSVEKTASQSMTIQYTLTQISD